MDLNIKDFDCRLEVKNGIIRSVCSYGDFKAEVIADSVADHGGRLTTLILTYWRSIHAEYMTHRDFSKNVASSRAIPVMKMLARVLKTPFIPFYWGANQAGMQAQQELTGWRLRAAKVLWRLLGLMNVAGVWALGKVGLHKQVANRPIEPWLFIDTVMSATEFGNFENLRIDGAAAPEIQVLAACIHLARKGSTPQLLKEGEYHLPFVTPAEKKTLPPDQQIRSSVARCARTSYFNHDGSDPSIPKDNDLYLNKLLPSLHMSPFEHVATPAESADIRSGNFKGWYQWRKQIPDECRPVFTEERFYQVVRP